MSSSPFVCTIDGPAGVGKSTLAKRTAQALAIAYLDTGAMFRTIALRVAKLEKDTKKTLSGHSMVNALGALTFSLKGAGENTLLFCNQHVVGKEVRTEEAGMMAARIAVIPEIRELLKKAQKDIGTSHALVAEGRDMGTVIFPNAPCKFFLDATAQVRAQRRFQQLKEMGEPANLEEIIRLIRERDEKDRNRPIAPLQPAADAVVIDTSHKNFDEVFTEIMSAIPPHFKKS